MRVATNKKWLLPFDAGAISADLVFGAVWGSIFLCPQAGSIAPHQILAHPKVLRVTQSLRHFLSQLVRQANQHS
jgi:hypothetical protein